MTDIRERLEAIQKAIFAASHKCQMVEMLTSSPKDPLDPMLAEELTALVGFVREARLLIVGDEWQHPTIIEALPRSMMTPTKGNEMKQAYLLSNNQGENVYAVVANNSTEALATLFEEAPDYDDGTLTDDDFKALKESSYSLHDHNTGEELRQATAEELVASINAAIADGGIGVIKCADRRCYVA